MRSVVNAFEREFKITNTGEVDIFLSIHVTRDRGRRLVFIDQTDVINNMCLKFGFPENSRINTPLQENQKIVNEEEHKSATKQDRDFALAFPSC